MRRISIACLVSAVAVLTSAEQEQRRSSSSIVAASRPAVPASLGIFEPIHEGDLSRIEDILVLSDAQRAALGRFFELYEECYSQVQGEIEETSGIALSLRSLTDPQAELQAIEAMYAGADRIRRRMIDCEDVLIDSLAHVLSETQTRQLAMIQRWRDRIRYSVGLDSLPGARVDIVRIMEQLDVEKDEMVRVQAILDDYETAIIPLLRRRHQASIDRIVHGTRHRVNWAAEGRPYDDEFVRQRRRILTPRVQFDTQLRSLNTAALAALANVLSEEHARRITDLFDAAIYSTHYPDRNIERARDLFRRVLDADVLAQEERDEFTAQWEMFEIQYDRLRRLLDAEVLRFQSSFQATLNLDADEANEHDEFIRGIRRERQELADRALQTVLSLLTEEQIEAFTVERIPASSPGDRSSIGH